MVLSVVFVIQSLIALLISHPIYQIETEELRSLFAAILFVVLALELNHLLVQYAAEERIMINSVLSVVIIAFARKLLLLKLDESDFLLLIGGALVLLSTGITYWVVTKANLEAAGKSTNSNLGAIENKPVGIPRINTDLLLKKVKNGDA